MSEPIVCTLKSLPESEIIAAAHTAVAENPANYPRLDGVSYAVADGLTPHRIALLTSKYWSSKGVDLSVSFMEPCPVDVRDMILSHLNAANTFANIRFRWTQGVGQVRISRGSGGYWSYLGTDILHVSTSQQTMNLEGVTMEMTLRERRRVISHEGLHSAGVVHEHLRAELVADINPALAIPYYRRTQGWDEATTRSNVLTPIEESSLMGTKRADRESLSCYQIPAEITYSGMPIIGGVDYSQSDREYLSQVYPLATPPPPPPPPPVVGGNWQITADSAAKSITVQPPSNEWKVFYKPN